LFLFSVYFLFCFCDCFPNPTKIKKSRNATITILNYLNDYGALLFSYGSNLGLWELAVIGKDGRICYDTPITSDVLGHLTEEDVNSTLEQIAALPSE